MGKMKEFLMGHVDRISWGKYNNEFYCLTKEQQDEVWELAEQAGQELLASQIDATRDRASLKSSG